MHPLDERERLVATLEEKRERLNQQAHRQRDVRDRLNDQTRAHAQRRDGLNAEVRGLIDRANQHKTKRDDLNRQVREAKQQRDVLNADAHDKAEALHALRREKGVAPTPGAIPLPKLRAEIKHLEFLQQTTVLTPKKEKDLIDLITSKRKELAAREGAVEENSELAGAWQAMKDAKARAEEQHAAVTALANAAQAEHDAMGQLFGQADGLRKEADAAQGEFVKSKIESDKVHREYIEAVSAIRDIERVLQGLRGGGSGPRSSTAADKAEADDIFDKFRKGEKLTSEDLFALQKGGRL